MIGRQQSQKPNNREEKNNKIKTEYERKTNNMMMYHDACVWHNKTSPV